MKFWIFPPVFLSFLFQALLAADEFSIESTRISSSLEVPTFVPPAPVVPKIVPEMRVDAATTVPTKSSTTLTLIRGEASALPDIPPPVETIVRKSSSNLSPEEHAVRNAYNRRHTLQLGAMVHDHRVSVVHWKHPDNGESYEAVCGFDISLLENIGTFIHNGENFSVMLHFTPINTSVVRRFGRIPEIPNIPTDAIIFLKGNANDPLGTAPINLIKKLLIAEKDRLISYQAARKEYNTASLAWEKANPPVPRDETIWLRPHRGSRYLADPRPEAAAR